MKHSCSTQPEDVHEGLGLEIVQGR